MNVAPFVFGRPVEGEAFIDRPLEIARLKGNFEYGTNAIVISPRRMGKTSLVRKVAGQTQTESIRIAFIDAFHCRNEDEFLKAYATAVIKASSCGLDESAQKITRFLPRLAPRITLGTDPLTDFGIEFEIGRLGQNVDEILALPQRIAEENGIRIIVCIDEFQQIAGFEDSLVFEKRLRGVWQHLQDVSFCLTGCRPHVMNTIFQRQDHPFYRFADMIYLSNIPKADWVSFVCDRFAAGGKSITRELAERLVDSVNCHSSYVQQLAWILLNSTEEEATDDGLKAAMERLLDNCQPAFVLQTEGLTAKQVALLRAICDGVEDGFTTRTVLEKYRLGVSSNVIRVRTALLECDLIAQEPDGRLVIEDPVFKRWLIERFRITRIV